MFDNIGGKIKALAVFCCWAGIIASWIMAISIWSSGNELTDSPNAAYGLLVGIVGSLVAWISSFLLYGIGELIDNTNLLVSNFNKIVNMQSKECDMQVSTGETLVNIAKHIAQPIQQVKIESDNSIAENGNTKERVFLVHNYNPDIPVRHLEVYINEAGGICLSFWCKDDSISAMAVKPYFTTVFGETEEIGELQFARIRKQGDCYITEYVYSDRIRELQYRIKLAKVIVTKYIKNDEIIFANGADKTICLSDEELQKLQDIYGMQAMGKYQDKGTTWICICGKENECSSESCTICGSELATVKEGALTDQELFNKMLFYTERDDVTNVQQIDTYFTMIKSQSNSELCRRFTDDLKRMLEMEKYYGYTKKSAINVIKSYIEKAK